MLRVIESNLEIVFLDNLKAIEDESDTATLFVYNNIFSELLIFDLIQATLSGLPYVTSINYQIQCIYSFQYSKLN